MIFQEKKFNREMPGLAELSEIFDPLTQQEMERLRRNILAAIAGTKPQAVLSGSRTRLGRLVNYIVAALTGLFMLGATAFAAGNAIPGDILYPVKITTEKIELSLAPSEQSKASLQAKFARERLNELGKLTEQSLPAAAKNSQPGSDTSPPAGPVSGQLSATGSASTAISAPQPEPDSDQNDNSKLAAKSRRDAAAQVNQALSALSQVQRSLESKGQTQAAGEIENNISSLQAEAQSYNLDVLNVNQAPNQNQNTPPGPQNSGQERGDRQPPAAGSNERPQPGRKKTRDGLNPPR